MKKETNGITLIALVITIIVLLILAGVTINLTLGNNGIFKTAQQGAKNYTDAQNEELGLLNEFSDKIEELTDFDNIKEFDKTKTVGVNKPKLLTGMTPIKFTAPTDTVEGAVQKTTVEDTNWYDYEAKKWANAQTADGSMWVWIPRYAYRINSSTQTCDIVFLIGSTDQYYDENGQIQTAKRQTRIDETIDTTIGYTVHPAFTDERNINFANGGWDDELTGIWVAKFEAGYAGGNNNATKGVSSGANYSQTKVWAPTIETGIGTEANIDARNWTDGVYGATTTAIKYPTFQGISFAMNYINHNDAFNISRALTKNGNIYGLSNSQTDSHLMKNSEWGAIAYLSQSEYGLNGTNIYINNVNLNNSTQSVYAVTGCCRKTEDASTVTTIEEINDRTANVYVWSQKEGQKASTTGTIYGIYDMSGGVAERTAAYVANRHGNLKSFGESIVYDGDTLRTISTKYTMVYPHDASLDIEGTSADTASKANYVKNKKIYGDAVRETSTESKGASSWYGNCSYFPAVSVPFLMCGDTFSRYIVRVYFLFDRSNGSSGSNGGFRPVLVAL